MTTMTMTNTTTIESFKVGINMSNFIIELNKKIKKIITNISLFERDILENYDNDDDKKNIKKIIKKLYVLFNSCLLLNKHIVSGKLKNYHKLYYYINMKFNDTLRLLDKYNFDDVRTIYIEAQHFHNIIVKLNKIYIIFITQNKFYIDFSNQFLTLNFNII